MIVDTQHGEFECKDITRNERRALYKKVKMVGANSDLSELHDLADEFALIAFGDNEGIEKALGSLPPLQEDEVLNEIIASYMGLELGNAIGD